MTNKKKKALIFDLLILVCISLGILLLLYPKIANAYNCHYSSIAIESYQAASQEISTAENEEIWQKCQSFNQLIKNGIASSGKLPPSLKNEYNDLLNITGNGIMASIDIPKIDVHLPIYHGTDDTILAVGVGHLEYSSLPIGGESSHCALAGHSGYTSNAFFTNLQDLSVGDVFYLKVLDKTLTYRIDQIKTVLPYEVSDLAIVEGEDLCTLITCTPTGINSHRLLVRGKRVLENEVVEEEKVVLTNGLVLYDKVKVGFSYSLVIFGVYYILNGFFKRVR